MTLPIAIVGASGYTGQQLVELVLAHPRLKLEALFGSANTAGSKYADLNPKYQGEIDLEVLKTSANTISTKDIEHVFLATPHKLSMTLAPELVANGHTVFDLSGAFRLQDIKQYPQHYGFTHKHPHAVSKALYGLPELTREQLPSSKLISLPGCYATSVIMPIVPLVRAGLLNPARPIIADSVSGVSGAGISPSTTTSFCEVSQSPYAVLNHRHTPEMIEHSGADVIFTPHLGPYKRGILSTIHADLHEYVTRQIVVDAIRSTYKDCPFVRIIHDNCWPSVKAVEHTNMIDIGVAVDSARSHLILISAIDNLLKGASGQAIQAFNIHMGWDERLGILPGAWL